MHCKVSLTQFSQFAWNIWMKSNKEKFSNQIWWSIFVKEIPPDQRLHALDAQYRNQRDRLKFRISESQTKTFECANHLKNFELSEVTKKINFLSETKVKYQKSTWQRKNFFNHISKMNPFLVTHSSNKIYLRTFFVVTTFNSFPKPLEAIYLYTICKECVRELNRFVALSLIVG